MEIIFLLGAVQAFFFAFLLFSKYNSQNRKLLIVFSTFLIKRNLNSFINNALSEVNLPVTPLDTVVLEKIYLIKGNKVMLDHDLEKLVWHRNQAVKESRKEKH